MFTSNEPGLSKRWYTILERNLREPLLTHVSGVDTKTMLHRRHSSRGLRLPSLSLAQQPPRSHRDSDIKRVLRAHGARDVLAHDIERGPVRGRGDHHRQPALHGDAAVEAEQLHGDLALVVVHGDDAVVVVPLEEDGVAGEGALGGDALGLGGLYGGFYVVDLVAPEVAALAVVRI